MENGAFAQIPFENIMGNGAFAPIEQMLHSPQHFQINDIKNHCSFIF